MIEKPILKKLFLEHYSEMIYLARTLLYADEEAEDVVQDVFLRLMTADIMPAEGKMRAYLMASVRNGSLNRIRQKTLTERVKGLYAVETETTLRYMEERTDRLTAVCDCADSCLNEPHRTIFRLRFEEGLTLKEIAQRLDMNLKTVFKYLTLSIQNIQKQFRH